MKHHICRSFLSIALCSLLSISTFAVDNYTSVDPAQFTDAANISTIHWEAVATLANMGIVNGKGDGTFDPAAPVTRGEAAKLIAVMAGDPEPSGEDVTFSDVEEHWAKRYIESCAQMGIISGRGDGTFDPDGGVSLYELAKMTLVLIGYEEDEWHLTGPMWIQYVDLLVQHNNLHEGLTEGTPHFVTDSGLLDATTPANREQCAQLLYNTLKAEPCRGNVARDENGNALKEPHPDGGWQFKYEPSQVFLAPEFQKADFPAVPTQPTAK